MRILFLDIDGVCNSTDFAKTTVETANPASMLDPEAIARLNKILDLSGAQVVISSSWRVCFSLGEINIALAEKGFTGEIIGQTPLKRNNDQVRGHEIQAWLDSRAGRVDTFGAPIYIDFVILDDDADMAHLMNRLIQTSCKDGLQDHHIDLVVSLFEKII